MINPNQMAAQFNQLIFAVTAAGRVNYEPCFHRGPHSNQYYSLQYVSKGKGSIRLNGESYPAEPGKIIVLHPTTVWEWRTYEDHPVEFYRIRFEFTKVYKENEEWQLHETNASFLPLVEGVYKVQNSAKISSLFEKIYELSDKLDEITKMHRKTVFNQLLFTIVEDFKTQQMTGNASIVLQNTLDYMRSHYNESISIESLSKLAGMSASHFTKLFKQSVGYSPYDYILRLRMNKAKELLEFSNYLLKEIAQMVGYSDELYFSRIFKKLEGMPPSEYIKSGL